MKALFPTDKTIQSPDRTHRPMCDDKYSPLNYMLGQEIGRKRTPGTCDQLSSSLYSSFKTSRVMETTPHKGQDWGAVFGFGFSPDGKILTAACEHRCMMLYDPLNEKLITRRFDTHDDCVNCVRFLDNRVFATCSDDNTVRLWDCRFLTNELRILRGHSSWVKNIEYASSSGKLVTSGFDGNIFAWDINNFSTNDCSEPVFYINGALRTKMTRDENKLIVSTLGGYFLLIHNLDLDNLKEDLAGFKPHLYRLMQLMNTPLHHALQYNYMFTRRRNRVEFMCDFPDSDNAESIATLQIHPHDWCVVSRNTTLDEDTEWTCVHDIQSAPSSDKVDLGLQISPGSRKDHGLDSSDDSPNTPERKRRKRSSHTTGTGDLPWTSFPPLLTYHASPTASVRVGGISVENVPESSELTTSSSSDGGSEDDGSDEDDEVTLFPLGTAARQEVQSPSTVFNFSSQTSSEESLFSSSSSVGSSASSAVKSSQNSNSTVSDSSGASFVVSSPPDSNLALISNDDDADFPSTMPIPLRSRWQRRRMAIVHTMNSQQQENSRSLRPEHLRIRNVRPRLLYYSEEPNVGRGFIKEQSFSSDGRVIASPFGNHIRLLAFDKQCREICDTIPTSPRPLVEVSNCALLKSNILASTFSPVHCLLVAGAVDGSIAFCHPVL